MPRDLLLNALAQVLDEVEAVGDLDRLGSAVPGTLGKKTVPIAADNLHFRTSAQPSGRAGGGSVG